MTETLYLTQADIETEISRLSTLLEATTEDFGAALNVSRQAEADYRIAYARAFTTHRMGTERIAERTSDQLAVAECEDLLKARLSAEAIERFCEEKCRSLRAQLDAVRTLSANVRAQT